MNSKLTPYQDELLTILAEECSETIREICKISRFGIDNTSPHNECISNRQRLIQEIGDIIAMVDLLVDSDIGITYDDLAAAKQRKLEKVGKWMTHKKPTVVKNNIDDTVTFSLSDPADATLFAIWTKDSNETI